jgi:hypothetical protein
MDAVDNPLKEVTSLSAQMEQGMIWAGLHLKTLLHWFANNYITEFDSIVLSCKFYFLHTIFRKNYARDAWVI